MKHADIWHALDRLASLHGYSSSGLAKRAGLDPTSFNKSKRFSPEGKERWPSTESISKVLAVTNMTMSDFIGLIETDPHGHVDGGFVAPSIPLLGYAEAGKKGYFDDAGYPVGRGWDEIQFPDMGQFSKDEHIYALEISGNSMEPLYRAGDIIILSPNARLRRGDRVVVKTEGGEVMAKEFIRKTSSKVDLHSLNPDHGDPSYPLNQIKWMARILWVSQ